MTQTCLRHRHHHLSTMRRPVDDSCGSRRSRSDHQDSHAPGLADSRPTTGPGRARRIAPDSLIPPRIPVPCPSRHSPFAQFLHSPATREQRASPIREQWAGQTLLTGGTPIPWVSHVRSNDVALVGIVCLGLL